MSRVVDTRVAEMRFDNKDFEQNVAQSMSTLDKLKQALNFGDAGKAFDEVSKAASGMNLGGIGDAVDSVKEKFSALEIAGITALVNLTNKAVDAGAQMVKSLTIDQVTAGFDKYAEKTTAVQTIMAATKSQFEDEGEQMEYVNEQLDKLNWFTDETSYNLVDMTSNIGKFTNAGIKLDDAVTSMMGVATWAGISGANAQEASRAMYNLAQATGSGFMQLVDWKSIENANMATLEFKEMAIQAGLAVGTLQQVGDEIQTVDTGLAKKYSAQTVTAQNFASTLTSGAWLTTEVLNKVLDQYGSFTNALNAAYNETGLETMTLLQYTEDFEKGLLDLDEVAKETGMDTQRLGEIFGELSSPTYELGRRAFRAAQETKTFAEVIDYTKDAVSSGWMNTFELIFGDYEEAKAMWSDLAEVFYEIFVVSGEARNEMLEAWKELGGRTSMLEAVSNAYEAIVKVIDTVKEAFHDIFPAKESEEKGQALFDFTERVREFTEKLLLSDEAAEKLKAAVTPLFKALKKGLDAVREVGAELKETLFPAFKSLLEPVKTVLGPLGRVVTTFKDLVKFAIEPMLKLPKDIWYGFKNGLHEIIPGFEDIANKAAIWLTNFNETLLTSEKLQKALQKIHDVFYDIEQFIKNFFNLGTLIQEWRNGGGGISGVLEIIHSKLELIWATISNIIYHISGIDITEGIIGKIAESISGALEKIKGAFASLKGTDTSGVDKIRDDTEKKLGPVASLFEGLKKVLSGIWGFLKQLSPLFSSVSQIMGSALGKIGDGISKAMSSFNAGDVLELANGGILVAIGLGIKKLIDWINELKDGEGMFSGIISGIKDAVGSVTGVLDSVRGALETWQENLKSSTLLKLAAAIGVITIAVIALSEVDPEKLGTALTAITFEFGELMASLAAFSKISATMDKKGIMSVALVLIELSVAVVILSSAVKSLSSLEWGDMVKGLAGVGVICYELTKTLKNLDLNGLSIAKGIGLMLLAASIKILASSVKSLSELSWGEMIEGLAGVGVLCWELSKTLSSTNFDGMSISKGVGILILAASLKVLASAVKQMSQLNLGEMIQGLAGVGAMLLELSLFMNNSNLDGMSISRGVGLLVFAAALKVMASAVKQMTELEWGEMLRGLTGMAGILLEIVGFMKLLEMTQTSGGNLIAIAAGMVVLGAAMEIIADVMQKFGGMEWEDIAQSLVELGGSLLIIAGGMALMKDTLPGAAALLVVAAALGVLNPVIQSFGNMEWGQILKSLLELAGIFTIIGAAGFILAPITPIILALAAAVAILGVGITGIGAGVALLGTGLAAVAVAGVGAVEVLIFTLAELVKMIPDFVAALGQGFIEFIKIIGDSATEIANTVIKVGQAILVTFRDMIPDLIETVLYMLDEVLKSLVEHGPSVVESVVALFMMLLDSLSTHLPELINFVIDALFTLIAAITERIPDFIQAGIDIVIGLIDGLGQGLVDNAPRLRDSLLGLLKNLLEAVLSFFGIHSPSTVFADIGEKLILGLIEGIKGMAAGAVKAITKLATDLINGIKGKFEEFKNKGKELVTKIKDGISDKAEELKTKMSETISAVKDKISEKVEDFKKKGKELVTKIKDGISEKRQEAYDKITEVVTGIKDTIGEKLNWFSEKGGEIMDILKSGMSAKDKLDALKQVMTDTIGEIKDSATKKIEDFVNVGKEIVDGLKQGISDKWEGFKKWTGEKFDGLVQGWNDFWDINSPSKLTAEMGRHIMEGLAVGINDKADAVSDAVDTVNNFVNIGMSKFLNNMSKDLDDDLHYEPVISPVVDLTNYEKGMSQIRGEQYELALPNESGHYALSLPDYEDVPTMPELAQTSENLAESVGQIFTENREQIQNELKIDQSEVLASIETVRTELVTIRANMHNLKVMLNSGAIVGGIIDDVDQALGQRSILAGRGV